MNRKRRKICVLTGTRAEYGLLKSLLEAIEAHDQLRLQLVVTGMHLVPKFGNTIDDIIRDGSKISHKIPIYSGQDRRADLGSGLAELVSQLSRWLLAKRSDFVVVLGDRLEAMGGALAGLASGVPVAHIHGGEIAAGDMDDRIRHAVSALANVHFVATQQARTRLVRAGQPPETVYKVGAIGLDHIRVLKRQLRKRNVEQVRRSLGLEPAGQMLLVVCHPCGFGAADEYDRTTAVLRAARSYHGLIIGPNTDPGHSGVLRAIRQFMRDKRNSARWRFVENLDRSRYLEALWAADVLVGNSSSGLLEANALGTAVVNIGPRQAGRQRNGTAIVDCSYSQRAIIAAVKSALQLYRRGRISAARGFGCGASGSQIASILAKIHIDRKLLIKRYLR